jgi:5-methylcytosine-specific restriction endonuclease McrA
MRHAKIAAARIGISLAEYIGRIASGEKWCTRCKAWHPRSRFGIDRSRGDGLAAKCLSLRVVLTPSERRERVNAGYRRYYAGEGGRAIRSRVYARKRGIEPLPPIGADYLLDWFGGLCAYCSKSASTFDHIVAVANGGRTEPGNIVPACVHCNSSKGARPLFPWLNARRSGAEHPALMEVIALGVVDPDELEVAA